MGFDTFSPILTTEFFTLESAKAAGNGDRPYYRLTGKPSIITFVLDEEDNFLMVRQFRPNLGSETIESPAGGLEAGENALAAAQRELAEEIGCSCALLKLGATFRLMMNRTNIEDHLFFGMYPKPLPGFQPEQGVTPVKVARRDLLELTMNGMYQQLGGIGLLGLVGGILQIDVWRATYQEVEDAFKANPQVYWG